MIGSYGHALGYKFQYANIAICDWILENQPNCHTWPIALSWPS